MGDERVANVGVYHVLIVDMIHLLGLNDLPLVQEFESIVLPCLLVLGELHFSKTA